MQPEAPAGGGRESLPGSVSRPRDSFRVGVCAYAATVWSVHIDSRADDCPALSMPPRLSATADDRAARTSPCTRGGGAMSATARRRYTGCIAAVLRVRRTTITRTASSAPSGLGRAAGGSSEAALQQPAGVGAATGAADREPPEHGAHLTAAARRAHHLLVAFGDARGHFEVVTTVAALELVGRHVHEGPRMRPKQSSRAAASRTVYQYYQNRVDLPSGLP